MAQLPLLDTNVFIDHGGAVEYLQNRFYYCAVVVQELLVGRAHDAHREFLAEVDGHRARNLFIVPEWQEWFLTGKCLCDLRRYHDGQPELLRCLVRDTLIACCAVKADAVVISSDAHFDLIQKVLRRLKYRTPSSYFSIRQR